MNLIINVKIDDPPPPPPPPHTHTHNGHFGFGFTFIGFSTIRFFLKQPNGIQFTFTIIFVTFSAFEMFNAAALLLFPRPNAKV